jgi:hypothetical protein
MPFSREEGQQLAQTHECVHDLDVSVAKEDGSFDSLSRYEVLHLYCDTGSTAEVTSEIKKEDRQLFKVEK